MARKGSEGPAALDVHWKLPADVRRRFGAYARFKGVPEGALVAEALRALMAGFHVGDGRAKGGAGKAPQTGPDGPPPPAGPDRRDPA